MRHQGDVLEVFRQRSIRVVRWDDGGDSDQQYTRSQEISVNGVVFYNQYAAGRQPLTSEIVSFDRYNGHPNPPAAEQFPHTEKVMLVDRDRRLRGVYNATLPHEIEKLTADAETLLGDVRP